LIEAGLGKLREQGAHGCCLVGHPHYYPRFGFCNTPDLAYPGVPPEVFFVLPFTGEIPHGAVAFHPAFQADGHSDNIENR
jgi:putative acetyltransferase